ncbi:MAG: OmpA family protein [Thermodesulfobacteriota bacterium]
MLKKSLYVAVLCSFILASAVSASASVKLPKVDNFYILMDASGSMGEEYGQTGKDKIAVAKDLIRAMNAQIPELDYDGALYHSGPLTTVQPMSPYDRACMARNIAKLPDSMSPWFGHPTPLGLDMKELGTKLEAVRQDRTAVIIFSDGGSNVGEGPAQAAKELDAKYPGTFCFYAVSLANRPHWDKRLQEVAKINSCSKKYAASCFNDPERIAGFVHEVFYTYAPDADKDGVVDANDRCPGTPAGAQVDKYGCALDDDNDGVINLYDECPNTPAGVKVDAVGCEVKVPESIVLLDIEGEALFEVDKAEISSGYYKKQLDELADFMLEFPDAMAMVEAHTDSTGPAEYNKKLSEKRAEAVKAYLVNKGIDAGRISAVGMGEAHPVADNDTFVGRRENRRAVIDVLIP